MKKFDVRKLVILSAFSAISVLLYCFLKFPLPIFPSFLEFNFSMLPILITVFMFGPVEAIFVAVIRMVLKLIFVGTGTAYVGEWADLGIAAATIIFAFIPYKILEKKNVGVNARTIVSLLSSIFGWCLAGIILNWLVLVPAYKELYFGGSLDPLVGMCSMIPNINKDNFMVLYLFVGVLPFNFCLSLVISVVTYVVHMRTYKIFSNNTTSTNETIYQ